MSDSVVLTELQDHIFTITLNRPDKANAFNVAMLAGLQTALKRVARESQARCVVLTGKGKSFSAGQDIGELQSSEPVSFRDHLRRTYNQVILQIRGLEKPVLAAINGTVAGAALGVALACDLRIAAEEARFVVGFLGIGLVPDSAVSLLLPQLIGLGRATEAAFTNQPLDAAQALEWGLVNRLVPADELEATSMQIAETLAQGPTRAFGLTKRAFNKAVLPNLEGVLEYEAQLQEIAGGTAEHAARVAAFLKK
jgi:2-(1,2-epoxy-1,2-dihydrophenyl)acetyl-CoA isomerase